MFPVCQSNTTASWLSAFANAEKYAGLEEEEAKAREETHKAFWKHIF